MLILENKHSISFDGTELDICRHKFLDTQNCTALDWVRDSSEYRYRFKKESIREKVFKSCFLYSTYYTVILFFIIIFHFRRATRKVNLVHTHSQMKK